jgi:hypothetical protein
MINSHLYTHELAALISDSLQEDERLVAACDFFAQDGNVWSLFLTSKYLRLVRFKRAVSFAGMIGKATPQIEETFFLPIETISEATHKQSLLFGVGSKTRFFFWLTAGVTRREYWTTLFTEGLSFSEAAEAVIRRNEEVFLQNVTVGEVLKIRLLQQRGILTANDFLEFKSIVVRFPGTNIGDFIKALEQLDNRRAQTGQTQESFEIEKRKLFSRAASVHVCPTCKKMYRVKPEVAGQRMRCKACGKASVVDASLAGQQPFVVDMQHSNSLNSDDAFQLMKLLLYVEVFMMVFGTIFGWWQYWWYTVATVVLTAMFILVSVNSLPSVRKG